MKQLSQIVAALVVLAVLVVSGLIVTDRLTDPARGRVANATALVAEANAREQVETDKQQADLNRQAAQNWQWYEQAWIAPAWAIFSSTLPVLLTVALGAGLVVALDAYRLRRRPLVWADRRGTLPVDRGQVEALTAVAVGLLDQHQQASGAAALAGASRQVWPQTYSPHISIKQDIVRPAPASPALPAPEPEAPAFKAPTFADLLTGGTIGEGQPLLLGFDASNGEAMTGSWLDLYSTAVAGMSGTGKTTSQRFLAAQVALQGARFVVVDPHAGAGGDSLAGTLAPLSSLFLCEPASTDKAILDAVHLVADIGQRRVQGRDRDRTPIILWLDECTSLLGRGAIKDELGELLERIAQEYRKRWVFACASGQIWTASRSGGSELRDSFASVLCHRMKRAQARLLLPLEEAQTVERLATGSAVLWRTSGESAVIRVPLTVQADIEGVARLLDGGGSRLPSDFQVTSPRLPSDPAGWVTVPHAEVNVTGRNGAEVNAEAPTIATPEALRAARLFMDGVSPAQIVQELRGINSTGGGRAYQRALDEVLGLIREGMKAGAV